MAIKEIVIKETHRGLRYKDGALDQVLGAEAQLASQLDAMRTRIEAEQLAAQSDAEVARIKATSEAEALRTRAEAAGAYAETALLRVRELEAIEALGRNANARIYVGVDKHADAISVE